MENKKIAEVNNETRKHILMVTKLIHKFVEELLHRATQHDSTKLSEPEVEIFAEYTPKLAGTPYGSKRV